MIIINREIQIGTDPRILGEVPDWDVQLTELGSINGAQVLELVMKDEVAKPLPKVSIQWRLPAHHVKGEWTSGSLFDKRIHADWEFPSMVSRISVNAPVLTLFGHEDENITTFACSDAINTIELEAPIREEDSFIYCTIRFFQEDTFVANHYSTQIYIDNRRLHFSQNLKEVASWWETFEAYTPLPVPEAARLPVYSTWYSYHQNFTNEALLAECRIAQGLGFHTIIVDDGWQTLDGGRGYDYTGDWLPIRLGDAAAFVQQVHVLGMKCMLWFSVPFCGKKSEAYRRFKGKFLTENHPWAPVFDPRYPEVRAYLIGKYETALHDWGIDGFKLDFIDDFKNYAETELTMDNGRDYASVSHGVQRLLSDLVSRLRKINPDVLIEFRQKYIGPAMRHYGNMIRAFDCPNDPTANRMRTTDVKLLAGATSVHSDMLSWHYSEPVESAALQMLSILFSVPQLSVRLSEIPSDHLQMIRFYTDYWYVHQEILLSTSFMPTAPLANYPVLSASLDDKVIYGLYDDMTVDIDIEVLEIDLINGKMNERVVMFFATAFGNAQVKKFNCQGQLVSELIMNISEGLWMQQVPRAGLLRIIKTK